MRTFAAHFPFIELMTNTTPDSYAAEADVELAGANGWLPADCPPRIRAKWKELTNTGTDNPPPGLVTRAMVEMYARQD